MTQKELESIYERLTQKNKETFNANGQIHPHALAISPEGQIAHIPIYWETHYEKKMLAQNLKKMAKDLDVSAYIFVSETYIIERSMKEYAQNDTETPSECPDRKEALMINLETKHGSSIYAFEIKSENGKPYLGENLVAGVAANKIGLFVNLLMDNPTVN